MELLFDIDGIRTPTRLRADIARTAPVHAHTQTHTRTDSEEDPPL